MKPAVGSAYNSCDFILHFVPISGKIQDNFTPFVHKFSKGREVHIRAYRWNWMEIDHSDRTDNVQVIKHFNLQIFFPTTNFGSVIKSQKFI